MTIMIMRTVGDRKRHVCTCLLVGWFVSDMYVYRY